MDNLPPLMTLAHALAAVVWVGGMFFAYLILRPALGFLEPPSRLSLWNFVFRRFFFWVWIAVVVLLATGYHIVFAEFDGFGMAPLYVHLMHGVALVMVALYAYVYFVTYRRYAAHVAAEAWPDAAGRLNTIRRIVAINLVLGLINVAIGSSGRFWG